MHQRYINCVFFLKKIFFSNESIIDDSKISFIMINNGNVRTRWRQADGDTNFYRNVAELARELV